MNREELTKELDNIEYFDEIYEWANNVMDDIESRTCKNCDYWESDFRCSSHMIVMLPTDGCNRFKRREDGQRTK